MVLGAVLDRMRRWSPYRNIRVWLWAINLPADPALVSPVSNGEGSRLQCRLVDPSGAGSLAVALALPLDGITERQTWCRGYAGHLDGQVVNGGWVSEVDTWVGEIAGTMRPGDGEAYIWDCQTAPAFRGRGFYRDFLAQVLTDLSQAGLRRAWIATLDRGSPGFRAVARAGFHPVVRIRYFSLGPVRRWWVRRDRDADADEILDARRALRLGQRPERVASTRRSAAPPAPVPG